MRIFPDLLNQRNGKCYNKFSEKVSSVEENGLVLSSYIKHTHKYML
jgi:hypothetical protein